MDSRAGLADSGILDSAIDKGGQQAAFIHNQTKSGIVFIALLIYSNATTAYNRQKHQSQS